MILTSNSYDHPGVRAYWAELDALNLEPPKTLDEIVYVAQQFMKKTPATTVRVTPRGINIYREWAFRGYNNAFGLEPICYLYGTYPGAWMPDGSGGRDITAEVNETIKG